MATFDTAQVDAHYERQLAAGAGLFSNELSQRTRWDVMLRHVPLEGRSLLDVGAGTGQLIGYLEERGIELSGYVATEPCEPVADEFARLHPGAFLVRGDVLDVPMGQLWELNGQRRFDAIVGVSITAVRMGSIEASDRYWRLMLEKLYGMLAPGGALALNWFTHQKMNLEPEDYVVDPAVLWTWCRRLTERVLIDGSYMPHDVTTVLYAGESDWKRAWRAYGPEWTREADRLRGR